MSIAENNARYCADLVSGLADAGVTVAFISPGSRNTPLTLAFASEPRIEDTPIRDERSAGFAAVGYGKATGRPAAIVCTSGSAAAHYFPAIVEADHAAVPLIVLTADRPARLRGTGAPQTMDQVHLYGSHVKEFLELSVTGDGGRPDAHSLADTALEQPAGPVHANIPLDEPLVPNTSIAPSPPGDWHAPESPTPRFGEELDRLVDRRVLIVAGGRQRPGFAEAVDEMAGALGAPVLADPQCWVTGPNTIEHGDLLAGTRGFLESHAPDVVLRLGPIPTSKPLWTWLERSGVEQILIDHSRLSDPLGSASVTVGADPTDFLRANPLGTAPEAEYLETWLEQDSAAGAAMSRAIENLSFPNEPDIARTLAALVPSGSIVHIGSSMPIRDVDTFAAPRSDITVLANRGVNGIDGSISTALGASLSGRPVTLLVGDVAALHDATALSEVASMGSAIRIVVVNNDGGGIFSLLPQASSGAVDPATFERHWGTPHGLRLSLIGEAYGLETRMIEDASEFADLVSSAMDGPSLIELMTERSSNAQHHRTIRAAVAEGLP